MGQVGPVGGHEVFGGDCADRDHFVVGAEVAHHPDALHGQQHGERLLHLPVQPGFAQLFDHDGVGLPEHAQAVGPHFAQAPHGEPRTGEGVPPDHFIGESQFVTEGPDLVLEQITERLDQFEAQFLGQPSHVVVVLDGRRRPVGVRATLDDVGVEGSLGQEVGVGD